MATSQSQKAWLDFIARYHSDADFAKQADADPAATLRKAGVSVPEGKQIQLVKNSDTTEHYVIPTMPSLSMEELDDVYAGCTTYSAGSQCS